MAKVKIYSPKVKVKATIGILHGSKSEYLLRFTDTHGIEHFDTDLSVRPRFHKGIKKGARIPTPVVSIHLPTGKIHL